mgnify:CR=1 FL=1
MYVWHLSYLSRTTDAKRSDLLLPLHPPLPEHIGEQMGSLPYLLRLRQRSTTEECQVVRWANTNRRRRGCPIRSFSILHIYTTLRQHAAHETHPETTNYNFGATSL